MTGIDKAVTPRAMQPLTIARVQELRGRLTPASYLTMENFHELVALCDHWLASRAPHSPSADEGGVRRYTMVLDSEDTYDAGDWSAADENGELSVVSAAAYDRLNALVSRLTGELQKLKPRKCDADMYADPPRDCNAPFCGCNPAWEQCMQSLVDYGWKSSDEVRELVAARDAALADARRLRELLAAVHAQTAMPSGCITNSLWDAIDAALSSSAAKDAEKEGG